MSSSGPPTAVMRQIPKLIVRALAAFAINFPSLGLRLPLE
jgi:hypothetical protein